MSCSKGLTEVEQMDQENSTKSNTCEQGCGVEKEMGRDERKFFSKL